MLPFSHKETWIIKILNCEHLKTEFTVYFISGKINLHFLTLF